MPSATLSHTFTLAGRVTEVPPAESAVIRAAYAVWGPRSSDALNCLLGYDERTDVTFGHFTAQRLVASV